jgi:hypothetical protein
MRLVIFLLILTSLIALTPLIADAQGLADTEPAGVALLEWVVYLATTVALAVAGWVALKASSWLKAKTGVETEVLLKSIAEGAVSLAEEKAYKYAKEAGAKLSSSSKRETAMDFARDRIKEYGLDSKLENKVSAYVDGKLGTTRDPGTTSAPVVVEP